MIDHAATLMHRFTRLTAVPPQRCVSSVLTAPFEIPGADVRVGMLRSGLAIAYEKAEQTAYRGDTMRSELVTGALKYVPNRYQLTRLSAKAIRRFHRPNSRIADTANEVLFVFGRNDSMARRLLPSHGDTSKMPGQEIGRFQLAS
jgi:hypothetical protein